MVGAAWAAPHWRRTSRTGKITAIEIVAGEAWPITCQWALV